MCSATVVVLVGVLLHATFCSDDTTATNLVRFILSSRLFFSVVTWNMPHNCFDVTENRLLTNNIFYVELVQVTTCSCTPDPTCTLIECLLHLKIFILLRCLNFVSVAVFFIITHRKDGKLSKCSVSLGLKQGLVKMVH